MDKEGDAKTKGKGLKGLIEKRGDPREVNKLTDHEGQSRMSGTLAKDAAGTAIECNIVDQRQLLTICSVNIGQKLDRLIKWHGLTQIDHLKSFRKKDVE